MLETVRFLINNGADVNAVADGDSMPLLVADSLPETAEKNIILELLLQK